MNWVISSLKYIDSTWPFTGRSIQCCQRTAYKHGKGRNKTGMDWLVVDTQRQSSARLRGSEHSSPLTVRNTCSFTWCAHHAAPPVEPGGGMNRKDGQVAILTLVEQTGKTADRKVAILTLVEWARKTADRKVAILTLVEWARKTVDRKVAILTLEEWARKTADRKVAILTLVEWARKTADRKVAILTLEEWARKTADGKVAILTLAEACRIIFGLLQDLKMKPSVTLGSQHKSPWFLHFRYPPQYLGYNGCHAVDGIACVTVSRVSRYQGYHSCHDIRGIAGATVSRVLLVSRY